MDRTEKFFSIFQIFGNFGKKLQTFWGFHTSYYMERLEIRNANTQTNFSSPSSEARFRDVSRIWLFLCLSDKTILFMSSFGCFSGLSYRFVGQTEKTVDAVDQIKDNGEQSKTLFTERRHLSMGERSNTGRRRGIGIVLLAAIAVLGELSVFAHTPAPQPGGEDILSPALRQWLQEQDRPVRIGVTSIPPQVFHDPVTGRLSGLCIDYIHEVETLLNYHFEIVHFETWSAMMTAAFDKTIDVIYAAQKTPLREQYFIFSDTYLTFDNKIVTTEDIRGPLTLHDLSGKKVAVVQGAAIEEYLIQNHPDIELAKVADELTGLSQVSFGRTDAMVIEIARASWYIQQNKFTNLHISGDAGYPFHLGFACRNDRPELADVFNTALSHISPERHQMLVNRWILPEERDLVDFRILFGILIGLALSLFGIFAWNRTLSRRVRQRTVQLQDELAAHQKDFSQLMRFQTIISLSEDLMAFVDTDYVVRAVNRAMLHVLDKPEDQIIGHTIEAIAGSEFFETYVRPYTEAARRDGASVHEAWMTIGRITHRYLKNIYHAYVNADGQLEGFAIVVHDITDIKDVFQKLEDNEKRLNSIIAAAPVGIGLVKNRVILAANKQVCHITGYSEDELVGHNSRKLYLSDEDYQHVGDEKYRQIGAYGIGTVETHWRTKDGRVIDVLLSSVPLDTKDFSKGVTFTALDITDRKAAEASLKESRKAMERLIDNLRGVVYRCSMSPDWAMEFISRGCLEMTGYADSDFYSGNITWGGLIFEEDNNRILREIAAQVAQKQPYQIEYRVRSRTGQTRWFWEKGCGIYDDKGQVEALEGFITDITDRKQTEQLLKASESRYRELIDLAVDGILLGDPDGIIIGANTCISTMTGKTRPELLGQHITKLFEPSVLHEKPLRFDLLRQGLTVVNERLLRHADGTPLTIEMHTKMMPDGTYQSIIRDITQRKQAEKLAQLNARRTLSLLRLNQMTHATIQELGDYALEEAIQMTESHIGYLAFLNEDETVLKMFSWSKSAMAECAVADKPIVYPLVSTGLWGEAVRQRRPIITNDYNADNPLKKGVPQGHVTLRRHMNVPVFSGSRIVLVAGTGNKSEPYTQDDVQQLTLFMEGMWRLIERRQAEQAREKLLKELRSKNEELQSIVFIASHDLRSPLVNIRGFAGELENSIAEIKNVLAGDGLSEEVRLALAGPLNNDIPEALRFIKSGNQKMDQLLCGLLRLSRIGAAQISATTLDIHAIIAEILKGRQFHLRHHAVDIAIEGQLPACDGDATLIPQVFENIIDNAVKYCDPNRPAVIRIRGRRHEDRCLYQIEDNGIGIAPEHKDKVFEIFHQLNPNVGGEGLGLTIVRRILDRQDGQITIDSQPKKGTIVTVSLPAASEIK